MKAFVDAAHGLGLMVLLDVVFNHLGLDGNHLKKYAPDLFTDEPTPWGPRLDVLKKPTRDLILDNALYWLEEFALDGLRLDAVDQIEEGTGDTTLLEELALLVRESITDRHVHLVVEDGRCITRLHERNPDNSVRLYDGVWNDGYHHLIHAWATGEHGGHFRVFAMTSGRASAGRLRQAFPCRAKKSKERASVCSASRVGTCRQPPSLTSCRTTIRSATGGAATVSGAFAMTISPSGLLAMLLLSPQIPLVFMGDEFRSHGRFFFFSDYPAGIQENNPRIACVRLATSGRKI